MPTRIPGDKKAVGRKKKKAKDAKDKAKKPGPRKPLMGGRPVLPKRRKPGVAQSDGYPGVRPLLFFRDLKAAEEFFTLKLGFELIESRQSLQGTTVLCRVHLNGTVLLLGSVEGMDPAAQEEFLHTPRGVGIRLVIPVADIDVYFEQLKATRVATRTGPSLKMWGAREFTLAEPLEGYMLTFSQPNPE